MAAGSRWLIEPPVEMANITYRRLYGVAQLVRRLEPLPFESNDAALAIFAAQSWISFNRRSPTT
jgi:hypothetical protein